ncbi:MAG: putative component of anaerobic dehydrogenase [Candidatus Methanohalarchaeum thermophilum]|uniref:Component of anaerobic dehydrogenase n=1 Tax=Methanohalarchaeum thermophilum TaxID=1903181 RepID=A0A1Q6DWB9_METT1|nr:MAG: putative component of anaerobic dehydrogenase [Candidatus Methanohalarchaeum thermophilum]
MTNKKELNSFRNHFYSFLSRLYLEEISKSMAKDIAENKFPIPDPEENTWMNKDMEKGFEILQEYIKSNEDPEKIKHQLDVEYTSLFHGPVSKDLYPYESYYIDNELRSDSLLEVKEFLREINYGKSDDFPEPEDFIAFELEIMRFLTNKPEFIEEKETIYKQKEFLRDHLITWIPDFCDDLYEKTDSDFYKATSLITKGFLEFEKEFIGKIEKRK